MEKKGRGRRKSINLAIASSNNHYAGFGPGTVIYSRIWWGCQRPHILKMRENKKEEDDKSHLRSSNSNVHQQHHNSKQSTISDFTT